MKIRRPAAFTLIELLTVIAIISLLAALLFPALGAAQRSAVRAKTKVQFVQWAASVEAFRTEYGYYPAFDVSGLVNGGVTQTDHLFHDLLAARKRDGSALAATDSAALQNRKRIVLHSFGVDEIDAGGLVRDASENTVIAVLVDRDLDGVIRVGTDLAALPAVGGAAPGTADFPTAGVRAGVVFYAPAPGSTAANPEFVMSWK
ncbi:MAG: hypothetical protein QG602_938 [Verrucomicrobiota bacterium]|nr:hypothetical protein [Verrucomicrobiota bacterium]